MYENSPQVTQQMIDAIGAFALEQQANGGFNYNEKILLDASAVTFLMQPKGMEMSDIVTDRGLRMVKKPHE